MSFHWQQVYEGQLSSVISLTQLHFIPSLYYGYGTGG